MPYRLTTRKRRPKASPRTDADAFPYRSRKTLLTPAELLFFKEGLLPAIGKKFCISAKVRLADVITCKKDDWEKAAGRRIQQKHLDFVLTCWKTSRIVAAIELNDKSHKKRTRKDRDAFLAAALAVARIPLVMIPTADRYDSDQIARRISIASK